MNWFNMLSIRWVILSTPVVTLALLLVMSGLLVNGQKTALDKLNALQKFELNKTTFFDKLNDEVATHHTTVIEHLRSVGKIDEGEFYDKSKPLLLELHEFGNRLKKFINTSMYADNADNADNADISAQLSDLITQLNIYRQKIANAHIMVGMNRSMLVRLLDDANQQYMGLNKSLIRMSNLFQSRYNRSVKSSHETFSKKIDRVAMISLILIIGLVLIAFKLSSKVADSLTKRIDSLQAIALKEDWETTAHKNELEVLVGVIERVKEIFGEYDVAQEKLSWQAKKLEKNNRKLKRIAVFEKQANEELSQFAYVASHDLKEPLRMVSSFMMLLSKKYKGKLDKQADEYIQYAVDGSERMRAMIDALLEYARVDNAQNAIEVVDCRKIVNDVQVDLSVLIEEKNASIAVDDLPCINADPIQIRRLFQNIIGNAIKYCADEKPSVHIKSEMIEGFCKISIFDNGIGIDEKSNKAVFEIFNRLHGVSEYEGTGIGLAVCKKIVERHGGEIWVEPNKPSGSCFCFTISNIDQQKIVKAQ